jgi:hypothetical protein
MAVPMIAMGTTPVVAAGHLRVKQLVCSPN